MRGLNDGLRTAAFQVDFGHPHSEPIVKQNEEAAASSLPPSVPVRSPTPQASTPCGAQSGPGLLPGEQEGRALPGVSPGVRSACGEFSESGSPGGHALWTGRTAENREERRERESMASLKYSSTT